MAERYYLKFFIVKMKTKDVLNTRECSAWHCTHFRHMSVHHLGSIDNLFFLLAVPHGHPFPSARAARARCASIL